jgi:hypothetical protein
MRLQLREQPTKYLAIDYWVEDMDASGPDRVVSGPSISRRFIEQELVRLSREQTVRKMIDELMGPDPRH